MQDRYFNSNSWEYDKRRFGICKSTNIGRLNDAYMTDDCYYFTQGASEGMIGDASDKWRGIMSV